MMRDAIKLTALVILLTAGGLFGQDEAPTAEAARGLLEAGRYPQALRAYELRLGDDPKNFDDLMGAGRALFGLHESDRALTYFSNALGVRREAPEPYAFLGRIAVRKAQERNRAGKGGAEIDLQESLIHFRDAIQRGGDRQRYRADAIEASMLLGAWEAARGFAEDILADEPENQAALGARRAALFLEGRYADFLEASRDVAAKDFALRQRRLEAQARLGSFAETTAAFRAMVRDFPNDWRPWDLMWRVWTDGSKLDRRIALFEGAAENWPEEAEPLPSYYLGLSYGQKGLYDRAVTSYEGYLDRYPENPNALRLLSLAHIGRGDRDAAHLIARKALVLHPDNAEVRTQVERVVAAHVTAKDFERALGLHQLIVAASPQDHALRRNEASLLKEVGRVGDACLVMRAILERDDLEAAQRATYMNDLALHLAGAGRAEEALKLLREALEIDPFQKDANENLGVFLLRKGEAKEAAAVLRRLLETEEPGELRWRARYHLRRALRALNAS